MNLKHVVVAAAVCTFLGCAAGGTPGISSGAGGFTGGSGSEFNAGSSTTPPNVVGATVGGQKDLGQARAAVKQGQVPAAASIAAEGLFGEHDFPIEGPPCTDLFCARPAVGRAKLLATGRESLFVHVGMAANLGADWKRPPADIVVVVDKGVSMSIDLVEVTVAINALIDKLGPADRLGVVVFDDTARELLPLAPLTDKAAAKAKVTALTANGGFAIQSGMQKGFDLADAARTPGRLSRVMLFTCGYPPSTGPIKDMIVKYADRGTGLSIFGVLLGFDAELGRLMSTEYGGNFFYLDGLDDVTRVFDGDLDFIITPLAYDLKLALVAARGVTVKRAWGIPADKPSLSATTVFPSRNKGAIVLELDAAGDVDPAATAALDFSYTKDLGATPTGGTSELIPATGFGVRKAVALVNLADALKAALTAWEKGQIDEARTQVDALITYLAAEDAAIGDPQLHGEVAFVTALRANMK